ncbi:hypothetical protein ACIBK9_47235 [Nonomuraea sp. NPDC050227]|uniref:hypothetical protein n=1 Tax=Nonomuraea sp. NPDC050227 TaxID=3364360 RepID=UPI0037AA023A
MTPMPNDPDLLSEALCKTALAGVTVNTPTQGRNEVYHLLNHELRPLCGCGEADGRRLMAVEAPWMLRCGRSGCLEHWRFIKKANEVLVTAAGDCYHDYVDCEAFLNGRRGSLHAQYHLHDVEQTDVFKAERKGKRPCPTCR